MNNNTSNRQTHQSGSSGFIDGYKASNFESNSSVIKFHEEEISDLLKYLLDWVFKADLPDSDSKDLLANSLKKAKEKLMQVRDFSQAQEAYIQSFSNFQSFLETVRELHLQLSPSIMLYIKKILQHYKMLGDKSMLEGLSNSVETAENSFLLMQQ